MSIIWLCSVLSFAPQIGILLWFLKTFFNSSGAIVIFLQALCGIRITKYIILFNIIFCDTALCFRNFDTVRFEHMETSSPLCEVELRKVPKQTLFLVAFFISENLAQFGEGFLFRNKAAWRSDAVFSNLSMLQSLLTVQLLKFLNLIYGCKTWTIPKNIILTICLAVYTIKRTIYRVSSTIISLSLHTFLEVCPNPLMQHRLGGYFVSWVQSLQYWWQYAQCRNLLL